MKIRRERRGEQFTEYKLSYEWRNGGGGFGFGCDASGNYISKNPDADANYRKCISGEYDVVYKGIERYDWIYTHASVGACDDCGTDVELDGFTNTCERCGADYNQSGQRLADRRFWGEETGEYSSDILRIP
jgi:hypothetical protein